MFTSRILTLSLYFATGFFIPVLSRYLMKFYPCSMHSFIGDIVNVNLHRKKAKDKVKHKLHLLRFNYLKKQYLYNRLLWGTLYLILFIFLEKTIQLYINKSYPLILLYIFLFFIGFSASIDSKCRLIPDIITFPLLMIAILINIYCQESSIFSPLNISSLNSIYSALGSYILCFTLALMFYFKNPYSFGGGDVKLITAISAFIGFENLGIILILSFITALSFLIVKKERYVALAPLTFASFILWLIGKILFSA